MIRKYSLALLLLTAALRAHAQPPATLPPAATSQAKTVEEKQGEATAPATAAPATAAPALTTGGQPALIFDCQDTRAYSSTYFGVDYLHWWVRRARVTPLVTTAPNEDAVPDLVFPDLPARRAGALGTPGTQVLFGDSIEFGGLNGLRVNAGFKLVDDGTYSIEASGFLLEEGSEDFFVSSTAPGMPFLTRPFFNRFTNTEGGLDISTATGAIGDFRARYDTSFWGWEVNAVAHPTTAAGRKLFIGFRTASLDEELLMTQNIVPVVPGFVTFRGTPPNNLGGQFVDPGESVQLSEGFTVSNRFYGPQVGADFRWEQGKMSLDLRTKVAAGVNVQRTTVRGTSTLVRGGQAVDTEAGALFAQPTNIGEFSRNEFTLMPELGVRLNYDLASRLRLSVGYDVLYWSSVVRPGDAIDRFVDTRQLTVAPEFNPAAAAGAGSNFPRQPFRDSAFWAHGVSLGFELHY